MQRSTFVKCPIERCKTYSLGYDNLLCHVMHHHRKREIMNAINELCYASDAEMEWRKDMLAKELIAILKGEKK